MIDYIRMKLLFQNEGQQKKRENEKKKSNIDIYMYVKLFFLLINRL